MRARQVYISLFVLILSITSVCSAQFDRLYIFGDSLSDTGVVYSLTLGFFPESPPYFDGRFSDGPVWVEYLTENLGLEFSENYSYATGGAYSNFDATSEFLVGRGLQGQVDLHFATDGSLPNDLSNGLFIIFIGGNDLLDNESTPEEIQINIDMAIENLYNAGARTFLLLKLPDLTRLPGESLGDTTLRNNVIDLNMRLEALQQNLPQEIPVRIYLYDSFSLYEEIVADPMSFGFNNITDPCLVGSTPCTFPSEYLWWDAVHPTTASHEILGNRVYDFLTQETGVSGGESWLIY